MATKIPLTTAYTPARPLAPPATPVLETSREEFVKVRLCYLTNNPKHVRNAVLQSAYGIKPPYNEDVCILYPAKLAFNDFETYMLSFEYLQVSGVLHSDDILLNAEIMIEDDLTLAYVVS